MTYQLTRFGSVDLPVWDPGGDIGTAPARELIVPTLGGAHDAGGSAQAAVQYPYQLDYSCTASGDTQALLQAAVDALRAMRGQRAQLWRTSATGLSHWCWARANRIPQDVKEAMFLHQPLRLTFTVLGPWHGAAHTNWYLDSGEYLDTGLVLGEDDRISLPNNVTGAIFPLTNAGNAPITGVALTLTAGSAPITQFAYYITAQSVSMYYDGVIAAGGVLVIDSGSLTVRKQGSDDYAHLHAASGHKITDWIRLAPGVNTLVASISGGGTNATLAAAYYEGWE
jgi:hypothetical protein